ncbi:MarR family winged helix-turn-helix transcriptional regulator [Streptomyces tubercidicus]|uniref:MarR family winged helix-turn-helix transcriptional regulator n=1 Tax=Streptomyces tubercidicus TaxID=47759 RepID=UPI002E13D8C6|nr:MarR family transcriptional regulator [Streptomyces tubercidicus]WSX19009.1 MarR family transcriptional regulator [Streptomyces tubercidicus]
MGGPTHLVELEYLVFGRHRYLSDADSRPPGSQMERSVYILLSRIAAQGPMSIGELSDAFGLDVSTLNRRTAAMKSAGLVDRIPDPGGGMARKFRITEEGTRRLTEEREAHIRALDLVMADWPEGEIAAFAGYLRRFNTSIERIDGRTWPRPSHPDET